VTVLKHMIPATEHRSDAIATDIEDALFNRWYMDSLFKARYPEVLVKLLAPHLPECGVPDRRGQDTGWARCRDRDGGRAGGVQRRLRAGAVCSS